MPLVGGRHDPYWEMEGQSVRTRRLRRRVLAVIFVALSAVLLFLLLARIATLDAAPLVLSHGRPLLFAALAADTCACVLILVREFRRPASA